MNFNNNPFFRRKKQSSLYYGVQMQFAGGALK